MCARAYKCACPYSCACACVGVWMCVSVCQCNQWHAAFIYIELRRAVIFSGNYESSHKPNSREETLFFSILIFIFTSSPLYAAFRPP